jgi:hypothetical protein
MNGRFSTDKLFGQVDVDTEGQVVYDSGRFLQVFPDALGSSFQLSVQRFPQVVVTVAILECCSNLFVRCTLPIHLLLLLGKFRTMDKVRKPNISVCYTPSSEPYSIYIFSFACFLKAWKLLSMVDLREKVMRPGVLWR